MPEGSKSRIVKIREKVRKRGPILLRCPHGRHYLTGIISPRGDFLCKKGERSNLYCTWPDYPVYGERVKLSDAVRGRAVEDGTKCCNQPRRSRRMRKTTDD
jgi:hypothetical protein